MKKIILLLSLCHFLDAQTLISKDYFRLPLDIPMQLAGNFAELRPNHFHAGFDFKTNQKEGLNVYATADGYVSRIKISNVGYGKAIYITHPNGYTTVYGHLQKAVGKIQEKIIENQYAAKEYEIESFFKPNELPVKKGDIIGVSGNTGGSEGPHLHFEIRDNKTEKSINPLSFGWDLKDTRIPQIASLVVFPISDKSIVNQSKRPISVNLTLQSDGTFLADKVLATGSIGFGIIASDFDNVSYNNNGIYKAELISNGKSIFGYEFDALDFDEARKVNALIDYGRYKKSHQRVQKLFMKNQLSWSNVKSNFENGITNVLPNFTQIQRLEVSDFNGNKVLVFIPISFSGLPAIIPADAIITKYLVKSKTDNLYEKGAWTVSFPANTFYDDFYMNLDLKNNQFVVHEDILPANSSFIINCQAEKISESERKKMFIASVQNGKANYINTIYKENSFSCKTKNLGTFIIAKDSIGPKINISKVIQNKVIASIKDLKFFISDDFSGIKSYSCFLNDEWILMEYESKLKRLVPNCPSQKLKEGTNFLKLITIDNVGNSTTFETQFINSNKN